MVLVTFWDGVRSWREVMPELLKDFRHDTIPFPHPFTVWALSFSFCIEWGSLGVKALERNNECTNNQPPVLRFAQCPLCAAPFEVTPDTTPAFAQPFRFTETPRDLSQTSGGKGSGTATCIPSHP